MTERASLPPAPLASRRLAARPASTVAGRDREFLPAALEILETPAPPATIVTMLTICAFFAAAVVWSFVGQLDVHAAASGKIETAGYSKVIEPLDPGKIAGIHVESGQSVRAGDLLFEIDPAEARADASAGRDALDATRAEVARRRFAIEAVRAAQAEEGSADWRPKAAGAPDPQGGSPVEALAGRSAFSIRWDSDLPEGFRLRQEAVLHADLAQLSDALGALDQQMAQKFATRKRLDMSSSFQHALMDTLNARVATRQQAIDLSVGTKINLYDAKEELQRSQAQLASDEGQMIETAAAIKELESERTKAISQFVADNENKLAEASSKSDAAREALAKAEARLERTRLSAPIDGVVQQTAVTTVGQVVSSGEQLAVVTPVGGKLEVQALVPNLDIGFVKLGQPAVVKVDAFPFSRFGVLHGKVVKIAPSAVNEQEAKRALANAAGASRAPPEPAAPGQAESFVFPVTVALDETAMTVDDARVPLMPGMTVTAEIKADSRRVIDYLISPLAKIAAEAASER